MATKKQKRLAGIMKAERDRQDSIASGLKAQKEDHQRRAAKNRRVAKKTHEEKHVPEGLFVIDCPLCNEDVLVNG